ncbi:DUF551 domain-containing protein [Achromobacter xylosoxidans]|uniref:DUF551 domain-containing protein n=1 Tax=Alcaligenes xylosoxydans xylosoxydans TaxID=85698 RepID=UPI001EED64A6|nr:DUF551 domain-containing protein [Achromobacter xylosoxidans]
MTNFYDVAHGLSQVHPGPEEPVEIAQQDDTLARTGNTARDQEMYAAGLRTGEENAKHNAAIRAAVAGWLPIESAPKDGRRVLLWNERYNAAITGQFYGLGGWKLDGEMPPLFHQPTHWMPLPAAPGVSTVEDPGFPAGAIVNGRTLADRLEAYPFESQGGDLRLCSDWVEFRRCFEYLAEWVGLRAPAAGDALDLNHRPDLHYILGVLDRLAKAAPKDQELAAALNGMRYVVSRTDAAIAAQRKGDA